jgi:hypothetical protein
MQKNGVLGRSYIHSRTKRLISLIEEDDHKARQELERELAQLELFCLMNGLSLELFDQWKLTRKPAICDNHEIT